MTPIRILSAALALAWLGFASPALGDTGAFEATDRNEDGAVDHAEYQARQLDVFLFEDGNKNGALEPGEAGLTPETIAGADTDGDGRLQMNEFLEARSRDFNAADTDSDGLLSRDEIRQAP